MPPNESQNNDEEANPDDVFRIMVATDNHLGFNEKDDIRGEDSFIAFEEILDLAVEKDVDFILLGGDLFHDAVPSQNALYKCMRLLRRVSFGDKPIAFEFLSDQSLNFKDALNQTVNYEDPNLNISIPIFSIHGNHDDPSGFTNLSSLDLLSTNGLVNYFGKSTDPTQVTINPILLKKGDTQLALYGLSHIRDQRLARMFRDSKVVLETPPESTGKWFNLMVLHQNRADRGPTSYLPENILPNFLDLVIWGHEHDCRIEPKVNEEQEFYVCQPGSSVATSLAEGETLQKKCGILLIHKHQFGIEPIVLQTVRPFVFKSINLQDYVEEYHLDDGDAEDKVMKIAQQILEEMILEAEKQLSGHPKQPTLPLIKLRIVYSDEQHMFNPIRFGQKYNQRVANASDCITFKKPKKPRGPKSEFDNSTMDDVMNMEEEDDVKVEDYVDRYFDQVDDAHKLQLFKSKILSEVCYRLAERNDVDSAEGIIRMYKEKALDYLMEKNPDEEEIKTELINFRDLKANENYDDTLKYLDNVVVKKVDSFSLENNDIEEDDDDDLNFFNKKKTPATSKKVEQKPVTTRGKGRGAGRGRGANRGTVAASTASKRSELDVSTISNRQSKVTVQNSITDSFSQMAERAQNRTRSRVVPKAKIVYEISDDSD